MDFSFSCSQDRQGFDEALFPDFRLYLHIDLLPQVAVADFLWSWSTATPDKKTTVTHPSGDMLETYAN